MRIYMERVNQCLAANKGSINIRFLLFSLVLLRRQASSGGLPTSAVQIQENTTRRKALNYSITAGFLSIFILEILSTQTTFCYYICCIPTFLRGDHSPHQPPPSHLPASHRYCENAWDSEGLGKSSTSLLNGNKSRVIHIRRRGK